MRGSGKKDTHRCNNKGGDGKTVLETAELIVTWKTKKCSVCLSETPTNIISKTPKKKKK